MEKRITVENLSAAIKEQGLIAALRSIYGTAVKVNIFFPDFVCKMRIEELNLSVRGYNC